MAGRIGRPATGKGCSNDGYCLRTRTKNRVVPGTPVQFVDVE